MLSKKYTLKFVLDLWSKSPQRAKRNLNQEKYLDIALRLYVLRKIDPKAKGLEKSEFSTYADSFTIDRLKDGLAIFDAEFAIAVEQGQTARSTGKNYRAALRQFFDWLEQQPWWQGLFSSTIVKTVTKRDKLTAMPKKKRGPLVRRSLDKNNLPDYLKKELAEFQEFRLTGGRVLSRNINQSKNGEERGMVRRPKLDPVKPSTIQQEEEKILYFLGWYSQKYPNSELHLELLTKINLLDDFIDWVMDNNQEVTNSTSVKMTQVAISIAKWLNYHKTNRRNWSDIPLILDLKGINSEYKEDYLEEKKILDAQKWPAKELSHEDARKVVDYLRTLCAERSTVKIYRKAKEYEGTHARELSVIVRAWQTYLLVKILVYCPIREEEIKNWVFNDSLFRYVDNNGNPYYVVSLDKHKRDKTGKIRHYPLPSILTEDLDAWLFNWRKLVVDLVQTPEGWMDFWGYSPNIIEQYQNKIKKAKNGIVNPKLTITREAYLQEKEKRLAGVQYRLDAWPVAQEKLQKYDRVFFSFGKKDAIAFGQPLEVSIFWQTVRRATAIATHALFGEAKWVNPHAFRHIGEKHLRLLGKAHLADAFGALIGHSKEIGDEYANQILSEYDITKDIVNNWWL
jgi:hypothetical protein